MNRELYDCVIARKYRDLRRPFPRELAADYAAAKMPVRERMSDRFVRAMQAETPHILPGQQLVFMRTVGRLPDILTEEEWAKIRSEHYVHELGYISNLAPDYIRVIRLGLEEVRKSADACSARDIDAILDLAARYRDFARSCGREDIAAVLDQVPAKPARNLREALQFLRILHYSVWMEGDYHNTLGRFDKYMYPYYADDLASGALTREQAYELVCEFFLSCNIDSDLYTGVQQGDNGQSLMLGGIDENGHEVFSDLSRDCLRASAELKLIDPKINLRVNSKTPLEIYELGSRLTAVGLGFPQYSNDDVVLPGLKRLGYEYQDAVNYSCAACWEFIVPGCGADIANIGALSYAKVIDRAVRSSLASSPDMKSFWNAVVKELNTEVDEICAAFHDIWFVPAPVMDLLVDSGNAAAGGKYNNFGLHGTGIACAADSLAAIEKYIYAEKFRTPAQLIADMDDNYAADTEFLNILRRDAPKVGRDDDRADQWLCRLLSAFSDSLEGRVNDRGGCYRAGTGSAMYYLWHANELSASPDGRRFKEPFGTNFSVSLFAKIEDPITVVKSFTKPDLLRAVNGGPLTLEFQSKMFDSPDGIRKMAQLVKYYIDRGGHQLQLNAVNRDRMLDAQKHPENYQQLIVRIWGWSAYFVELDKEFQDHVIARQEYGL